MCSVLMSLVYLQVSETVEFLLSTVSEESGTDSAYEDVLACLRKCPELLTCQVAQLQASISFLQFLDMSKEEVCDLPFSLFMRSRDHFSTVVKRALCHISPLQCLAGSYAC